MIEPGVPSSEPTDRVVESWPDSLVDLYREQHARMLKLAWLLTGSLEAAEEVVQEAFVRIRPHFGRIDYPVSYLRTCVVNGSRNHVRRGRTEHLHLELLRPERVYDWVDELADALMRLPYRQRAVLVLRYYLDCSEAEIARYLKCRPGTVKSAAHRGLEALRKALGQAIEG